MKTLRGIFVITKDKEEALGVFDNLAKEFQNRHACTDKQSVSICKAYCSECKKAIKECFSYEMWGPKQCLKKLEQHYINDDPYKTSSILFDVFAMVSNLRSIISTSVPIKDLPSCKNLCELSTSDAISAINDLGGNGIIKVVVCAGLLGKNISDNIEISEIENFYKRNIDELEYELKLEKREPNDMEEFLLTKYRAEICYCHNARLKTGIGIVKELSSITQNITEHIQKYEKLENKNSAVVTHIN
jgi:hypothetical protein